MQTTAWSISVLLLVSGCAAELGDASSLERDYLVVDVAISGDRVEWAAVRERGVPTDPLAVPLGDEGELEIALLDGVESEPWIVGALDDPRWETAPDAVDDADVLTHVDGIENAEGGDLSEAAADPAAPDPFVSEVVQTVILPAPDADVATLVVTLPSLDDGSPITSRVELEIPRAGTAGATEAALSAASSLRPGDRGPEVVRLQKLLNRIGYQVGGVDGAYGEGTRLAVRAFQSVNALEVDGVAGRVTIGALLWCRNRPAECRPLARHPGTHVEIDKSRQVLSLVRKGRVTHVFAISSGARGFTTPSGTFRVFRKEERSWSVPYSVWLPWASYFVGGIAVHQGVVEDFPASHGCVRVHSLVAERIYRFMRSGRLVYVF